MDLVSIEVSHGTLKVTARRGMLTVYWAEPIGIIEKVSLPGNSPPIASAWPTAR